MWFVRLKNQRTWIRFQLMSCSLVVHEKKLVQQDKEERALNASTDNNNWLPSRLADRGGDQGRRGGGRDNKDNGKQYQNNNRGNRDDARQYHNNKKYNDPSIIHKRGRGCDQNFETSKVECYRCHNLGHYQSECYTKLPQDKEAIYIEFCREKKKPY